MDEAQLRDAALEYHRKPVPGKISLTPTKALANQYDLSLAYSPGVAYACTAIAENPLEAATLTARANLVAVVTNGSAVLGLGNIGALAGKPVMEGKGCLFRKFAGIDVFDIEVGENDPDKIVDVVAALEPTFGGINLEDIKAPECFYIENKLRERMKIPVFHDDQHGTAIVSAAAVLNGLKIVGKDIGGVKLACSGAGAAAIACLDLLVRLGLKKENIVIADSKGVVHSGRKQALDASKQRYAAHTDARTLEDMVRGADIFLGLSTGGVLKPEMVRTMAGKPIILAMANPEPEIRPERAKQARPDCLIGTGRSDYPNQVNNSLCFPFIFRGALDCGATTINDEMKLAAVRELAEIAQAEPSEIVAKAYGTRTPPFGPDYLIPRAFDPRLIVKMAPAVAKAAMESGVAARPIKDFDAYVRQLSRFVYRTSSAMEPVFAAATRSAARALPRVAYAEGEDERVLRAAQIAVDEGLARPVLIGHREMIAVRIAECGLRLKPGVDCECIEPADTLRAARNQTTLAGAVLLKAGHADALLCGTTGLYATHIEPVREVIGMRPGVRTLATMQMLILPERQLFICDTQINQDPDAEQVAEIAVLAAAWVRRFGIEPRVALLSHSNFGSSDAPPALKMRQAAAMARALDPTLAIAGEMRGDSALSHDVLVREVPDARMSGEANVLVMPNLDAANISFNLLRIAAGNGIAVGGILLGAALPVHIMAPSSTVRRIVNMTAVAVMDASDRMQKAA